MFDPVLSQAWISVCVMRQEGHLPQDMVDYAKNALDGMGINHESAQRMPQKELLRVFSGMYAQGLLGIPKNGR